MTPAFAGARVAVVGAGMAGLACARRLAEDGIAVELFDKSRGVGGRMATRRVTWTRADGRSAEASFDHGAPGFSAQSSTFRAFVDVATGAGSLVRWRPRMAAGSSLPLDGFASWVSAPDMPALCRRMRGDLPATFGEAVDAITPQAGGWQLEGPRAASGRRYTQVVLAMPPRQAAALLSPHRSDWARQAVQRTMRPCWTLMGVVEHAGDPPPWDVAWPADGPVAWIIRNDRKPGRSASAGVAHWVVHATAAWSDTHLESPATAVVETLMAAVAEAFGRQSTWRFAQAHRWRYASAERPDAGSRSEFWLDTTLGLGVCGDWLGGAGVEGAWISGGRLGATLASECLAGGGGLSS